MRLVWSQPARRSDDRPRSLLLVSVLCLFLGGVVVGAGGRDLAQAPRPVRAAIASLLTTGAVLFIVSLAVMAVRRSKKPGRPRLMIARTDDAPGGNDTERHFGQEERR